jgi:hypothetical protein
MESIYMCMDKRRIEPRIEGWIGYCPVIIHHTREHAEKVIPVIDAAARKLKIKHDTVIRGMLADMIGYEQTPMPYPVSVHSTTYQKLYIEDAFKSALIDAWICDDQQNYASKSIHAFASFDEYINRILAEATSVDYDYINIRKK